MMEIVVLAPPLGDYSAGVDGFLSSLGWSYLRRRYPRQGQGLLLRLLTLSGLNPWGWERCVMQMVTASAHEGMLVSLLRRPPKDVQPSDLCASVAEIWDTAVMTGQLVGDPPLAPHYLRGYGYTQTDYLADLALLYGPQLDSRYQTPWPQASPEIRKPWVRPLLLEQAAALMGATAGAIEQLILHGGGHDDDRD